MIYYHSTFSVAFAVFALVHGVAFFCHVYLNKKESPQLAVMSAGFLLYSLGFFVCSCINLIGEALK